MRLIYALTTTILLVFSIWLVEVITDYRMREQMLLKEIEALNASVDALEDRLSEADAILKNVRRSYLMSLNQKGPVMSRSGFTADMYEEAWDNLGVDGLKGTGFAFWKAEKDFGVNGLVLAAVAFLESAGGGSRIAKDKNNLFGLGAYDFNPYKCALSFEDYADSIFFAASILKRDYLSREGRYFNGDDVKAIGKNYATDPKWADKVYRSMRLIVESIFKPEELLAW